MNRFAALCLALCAATAGAARAKDIPVTVAGGKEDRTNVVVTIPLSAGVVGDAATVAVKGPDGKPVLAQLTAPRLLAADAGRGDGSAPAAELVVLLPEVKAGQTLALTATLGATVAGPAFAWKDGADGLPELAFADRPVVRYFHKPFDVAADKDTTKNPTIKPFHHLFDPAGKVLLTNGVDGSLYPHHRGIFFGFNKCSYDGKSVDVWHGRPAGTHQSADKVLAKEAGPLLGRHRVAIGWHGADGMVFASEERELTAMALPGGTLVEFASIVRPEVEKVKLDGDPQHSGFHFRANDEVAKQAQAKKTQTYYLRPDGKGQVGETRNWEPKTRKGPVDLPWDALSFVLGGKRYTVVYLDRPDNPKEARFSERDYGRFGSYFEYELTKDKPLRLNYRLWAQEGEMTVEACAALSKAFVEPLKASVSAK